MRILAIESSCDETSAAILEKNGDEIIVLSNITATSLQMHAETGGIIPENAARMQVKYILPVIIEALCASEDKRQKTKDNSWEMAREILIHQIDAIATTYGPGLIGSLLVGVETVKTLAYVFNKPLIPVNHLLAHIYANFIQTSNSQLLTSSFPFIGLIVSGGHTDLLFFRDHGEYEWLGGTRDDAAGEAFDKIGRILGLPYPAGPEIERRANLVTQTDIRFKSPIIGEDNFDFSFSGLKTEVGRFTESKGVTSGGGPPSSTRNLSETNGEDIGRGRSDDRTPLINQICYATQKAIIDVLVKKTLKAAEKYNCKNILVGGGVSANLTLRKEFELQTINYKLQTDIFFPEKIYSTDNGAMIGAYALLNETSITWCDVNANPELYFA